jgi:hypothetical protein
MGAMLDGGITVAACNAECMAAKGFAGGAGASWVRGTRADTESGSDCSAYDGSGTQAPATHVARGAFTNMRLRGGGNTGGKQAGCARAAGGWIQADASDRDASAAAPEVGGGAAHRRTRVRRVSRQMVGRLAWARRRTEASRWPLGMQNAWMPKGSQVARVHRMRVE